MTDRQDQAELRLRAADPADPSRPLPPSRVPHADLLEEIMTTTEQRSMPLAKPAHTRWLLAAAALILAAAVGTTVALTAGGSSGHHPKTVAHLALPAVHPGGAATCIRFTVDILRQMPVAFSGTAVEVGDHFVLIDVDHWYKGGKADEVRLTNAGGVGPTMEGAITFRTGHRYLVSARDGTVSICGYSGEWTAQLQESFQEAFGH